jgi:hypothetical protein
MTTIIRAAARKLARTPSGQSAMECLAIACRNNRAFPSSDIRLLLQQAAKLQEEDNHALHQLLAECENGMTAAVIMTIEDYIYDPEDDAQIPHSNSDAKRTKP